MTQPVNVVFLNSTQHPLSLHVYGQLTEAGSIDPSDSQVVFILHLRWYFRRYPGSFEFDDFWSFGGINEPCGSAKNSTPKKKKLMICLTFEDVKNDSFTSCYIEILWRISWRIFKLCRALLILIIIFWGDSKKNVPITCLQYPLSFLVAFLMFLVAGGLQGGAGSDYSGAAHGSQPGDR